jgi:diaminopimelate epimerase
VKFSKVHGLGNDFIIADLRAPALAAEAARAQHRDTVRALCDRRFGVGADGVLAVLSSEGADARMRVLNADGSEAEMCGNGLRCVVKYLYERDPALQRSSLVIETGAGPLSCDVRASAGVVQAVTVNMGRPRLLRGEIPMTGPAHERCVAQALPINHASDEGDEGAPSLAVTAVSMGNPHAVAFVDQSGAALRALAEAVGPRVENHAWFPQRTNAELAHIRKGDEIELVVWERGCGITLACGTGACATAVAACLNGHARTGVEITVHLLGGDLAITVAEDLSAVFMRGPATHVFDADIDLYALQPR